MFAKFAAVFVTALAATGAWSSPIAARDTSDDLGMHSQLIRAKDMPLKHLIQFSRPYLPLLQQLAWNLLLEQLR